MTFTVVPWTIDRELSASVRTLGVSNTCRGSVRPLTNGPPRSTCGRQAIGWPDLLEASRPWSAAERLLVRAAGDLWNGAETTSLYDAVTRLDEGNFARLVEALRLRRGLSAEGAR